MRYSIIVPVYNRPDETGELLESLARQTLKDFETIIVEDGSQLSSREVCRAFEGTLDIKYFEKENSGPGQSRNYGADRASGDFLIVLDSDVILPPGYIEAVDAELRRQPCDAFGGPDAAHASFTATQKAISYSMTSFFTTGGIRGGKRQLDKFYPRSFNMGVRREVYQRLGGFSAMRFGEDIDFSIRIFKAGCSCRLFPEAWVWHKRRTDFRKFWRQVYNSGIARINLQKRHPGSLKIVHTLPMMFTVGCAAMVALAIALAADFACCGLVSRWVCTLLPPSADHQSYIRAALSVSSLPLLPIALYSLLVGLDSSVRSRSPKVGLLSIPAAFVQLLGYGCGFIHAWWQRSVLGKGEFAAYSKTFYK